jgi:hypothetical protein
LTLRWIKQDIEIPEEIPWLADQTQRDFFGYFDILFDPTQGQVLFQQKTTTSTIQE